MCDELASKIKEIVKEINEELTNKIVAGLVGVRITK